MKKKSTLLILLSFVLLVCVIICIALVWSVRDPIQPMSAQDLAEARRKWTGLEIKDYDLSLEVSGSQSGNYQITVRDSEPKQISVDGEPVNWDKRLLNYWTISGLFSVMELDLKNQQSPQNVGMQSSNEVLLHSEFDPDHSIPNRYRRIFLGQSNQSMEWKITNFQVR